MKYNFHSFLHFITERRLPGEDVFRTDANRGRSAGGERNIAGRLVIGRRQRHNTRQRQRAVES